MDRGKKRRKGRGRTKEDQKGDGRGKGKRIRVFVSSLKKYTFFNLIREQYFSYSIPYVSSFDELFM